ncbi:MAG: thioredoxin family protein [Sulfurisoma sp.]|nr:thioredoxin family protein [Sulfurisoma sp.]
MATLAHRPRRAAWWLPRWPRCWLRLMVAAILAWPPLASALPPARDLAADARQMREMKLPMLVLYSRAGCDWCERARRQFLDPLVADPATAGRMLIRQIDIDRRTAIADFSGNATSHQEFARGRNIRLTPTIEVLGPDGEPLTEAIVGVRLPDFYGTYIERAIDAGLGRLREKTP